MKKNNDIMIHENLICSPYDVDKISRFEKMVNRSFLSEFAIFVFYTALICLLSNRWLFDMFTLLSAFAL